MMNKLSFIMILILSIACTSLNAFAAQMKYSFEFEVGAEARFAGNPLDPATVAEVSLYGDTDDVFILLSQPVIEYMEGDLCIHGTGTFALDAGWTIKDGDFESGSDYVTAGPTDNPMEASIIALFTNATPVSLDSEFESAELSPLFGVYGLINTVGGGLSLHEAKLTFYEQIAVPIPNAMLLLSSGLAVLIGFRRKFNRLVLNSDN